MKQDQRYQPLLFFLGYTVFFLLLFGQFPIKDSLPGMIDSWWYIATFHTYENILTSWFTGAPLGTAFHPSEFPFSAYGEPSYLCAIPYLLLATLGLPPLWAYYITISLTYAGTAWGVYRLASLYVEDRQALGFTGIAFAASAFAFGGLDDIKIVFFGFAFWAIYWFKRFVEEEETRYLAYTIVCGSLQVYGSSYGFLFQSFVLAYIGIWYLPKILANKHLLRPLLVWLPLHLLFVFPFIYHHLLHTPLEKGNNPIDVIAFADAVSLNLSDLGKSLPNNLLYPSAFWKNPQWIYASHAANTGIVLWLLGIIGFWRANKWMRKELGILFGLSFLIALGPSIRIGEQLIWMPMYPLYAYIDAMSMLRLPVRMYYISLLCLVIFAGLGVQYILSFNRYRLLIIGGISLVFLLENTPFPFMSYESGKRLEPAAEYIGYLSAVENPPSVVLNLPSALYDERYNHDWTVPTREMLYVYWQTHHKQHVINGQGYIPAQRKRNQAWIDRIGTPSALDSLIQANELKYIVYHKGFELEEDDPETLPHLRASTRLALELETDQFVLFECTD